MAKNFFIVLMCFVVLFLFTACGSKNKESVSVTDSENYTNYRLKETRLNKGVEYKNDDVCVIFDEIIYEDVVTKFYFNLKNETDKTLTILSTDLSINSLMCADSIMETVEPKIEKSVLLEISNEWRFDHNIKMIKDLDFVIRVLDDASNEVMRSPLLSAKTDAPKNYVQEYNKNGFTVFKSEKITLLAQTLKKSKRSNDSELTFYVENNTEESFSLMATEVYVNDLLFKPTFIISIGSSKKSLDSMLFLEKDLTSAKIKEITSLKASFRAIDENSQTVFETDLIDIPLK